jgi:hypothetical protein
MRLGPEHPLDWPEFTPPAVRISCLEIQIAGFTAAWTGKFDALFRCINAARDNSDALFRKSAGLEITKTTVNMERSRDLLIQKRRKDTDAWNALWRAVSFENAPWVDKTEEKVLVVRDRVSCRGMAPVKVKDMTDKTREFVPIGQDVVSEFRAEIISLKGRSSIGWGVLAEHFQIRKPDRSVKFIQYSDISYVLQRSYKGHPTAIEILRFGYCDVFVNFPDGDVLTMLTQFQKILPKVLHIVIQNQPPIEFIKTLPLMANWLSYKISSYEYLTWLNLLTGASFNDDEQYPIFPWVIADLSSPNITNASLRDFHKSEKMSTSVNPWSFLPFSSQCQEPISLSGKEVIPEFYAMPELFENAKLPPWSVDLPSDFVYCQRKSLESPLVSRSLHQWISLIWGSANSSDSRERSVSRSRCCPSHPRRPNPPSTLPLLPSQVIVQGQFTDIIWAHFHLDELYRYTVIHVSAAGEVITSRFTFPRNPRPGDVLRQSQSAPTVGQMPERRKDILALDVDFARFHAQHRLMIPDFSDFAFTGRIPPHLFCSTGSALAFVDGQHPFLSLVAYPAGTRRDVPFHTRSLVCVAAHKRLLVAGGTDSVLTVFSVDESTRPLYGIPLYRGPITCVCVNADFDIIAAGTADGALALCSPHRRSVARFVQLGGLAPYGLTITGGWGFIAVFAARAVFLVTVNGQVLRQVPIPHIVTAWTSWCHSGFDFILIALDNGGIRMCEAFWLDFKKVAAFRHVGAPIIAVRHVPEELGIVALTASGAMTFLPFRYSAE